VLEQQCGTPIAHHPLDDRRYLEVRINQGVDPRQGPPQRSNARKKVLEINETHSKQA
jgi:hypothetical protein